MKALIKGLRLLLQDNALRREPLRAQADHWLHQSESDIEAEIELLEKAKEQWLFASIFGWQALSIAAVALVAHNLWKTSFHLSFSGLLLIVGTWVTCLFLLWLIASLFDKHAGFERWMAAFRNRAPLSPQGDSVQTVSEAITLAEAYPDVLQYKQQVTSARQLRHEDIRIMRDIGNAQRHEQLVETLVHLGA